jgi:pyruvate/2-oxoglutarate/acetoin dehydrogenase E1 component
MFSNRKVEKFDTRQPEFLQDLAQNPRVQQIKGKVRTATQDGKPVPKMKMYNVRDGIFEAMLYRFAIDPTMVAFGEENRDWGGAFAVYRGLTEALPYHRLFNSPISEAAIVGAAVGYALEGGRVVAELMYADFMGRAGDEIFNQLSKWQAMSAGQLNMPVVLRISVGAKYGAQHSQDWTALAHHIPGLKVVYPVTPYDAKGMMNAALAGTDPVVFFESQKVYDYGEMFVEAGVPEGYYEIDLSEPSIKRKGKDLTIMTFGPALYTAVAAADDLEKRFGISAELIDLRSANPLNYEPLVASVRKTGKVLLVRRRGARLRNADRRRDPDAALLRRPGRPPGGPRLAQLDHPRRRAGDPVLPAARLAAGCHPRAHPARIFERLSPADQPDARRAGQPRRLPMILPQAIRPVWQPRPGIPSRTRSAADASRRANPDDPPVVNGLSRQVAQMGKCARPSPLAAGQPSCDESW